MSTMATAITIFSTICVALISLIGTVITTRASSRKIESELEKNQAVQETKLEELTREVRQHNDFATRIPVLEQRINAIEKVIYKHD